NSGFTVIDTSTNTVIANVPMPQGTAHIALWEAPPDSTPPIITPTVTGTLGNGGWYASDTNISWSVTDGESSISSSTGCGTLNVLSDTSGTTFTCSATSGGGTAEQSVTIKRDATAPAISMTSPAPGAVYLLNQSVAANYSCSDQLSGVATC